MNGKDAVNQVAESRGRWEPGTLVAARWAREESCEMEVVLTGSSPLKGQGIEGKPSVPETRWLHLGG